MSKGRKSKPLLNHAAGSSPGEDPESHNETAADFPDDEKPTTIMGNPEVGPGDIVYRQPSQDVIVRRIRPEDIRGVFHEKLVKEAGLNNITSGVAREELAKNIAIDIQTLTQKALEKVGWGIYSRSGELREIFEWTSVQRLSTPADAKAFHSLYLSAIRSNPPIWGSTIQAEENRPIEQVHQFLLENYVVGIRHNYAFQDDPVSHTLVGFGSLERKKDQEHIANMGKLYVVPAHRSRKLAKALTYDRLDYAVEQGDIRRIEIIVTEINERVRRWYGDKLKFREDGILWDQRIIDGVSYNWIPMSVDIEDYKTERDARLKRAKERLGT